MEDLSCEKSKSRSARKSESRSEVNLPPCSVESDTSAEKFTPYISCESRSGEDVQPFKRNKRNVNDLTLLLDSAAGVNLFSNEMLLQNLESNRKQKSINVSGVMSEEGTKCSEMQLCDSLSGLPLSTSEYYINKKTKGTGNIISLAMLTDDFDVEMNSAVSNAFYVYDHNRDFLQTIPLYQHVQA